jgi:hypothetical protein
VTQPTFSPVPASGTVRATVPTGTPEFSRPAKPGLLRGPHAVTGSGQGTQAPGEGFALTIADRECSKLVFEHAHDCHDVAVGVGLIAAKRASLVGRGPQLSDVHEAMDLFGLRDADVVGLTLTAPFSGLGHSYVAQRRFVDSVDASSLLATAIGDNAR